MEMQNEANGTASEPIAMYVNSSPIMVAGTKCKICDGFIPVYEYQHAYPRICEECKKRLKKLLYESQKEE